MAEGAATTGTGALVVEEALGALGSLGAFTALTGAETGVVEAEAVEAEAVEAEVVEAEVVEAVEAVVVEGEAVAEAEVFVVLAIVLFVYTLYRDVFLSFFTNNIFIRAFQCTEMH